MSASDLEFPSHHDAHPEPLAMLGPVREDIRETLRMGWIDPAFESAASHPTFFTAAWSAIRPNVGRSFLQLVRSIRAEAVDAVRSAAGEVPDLRKALSSDLSEEEIRRLEDCTRAAHLSAAKVQIVVHALHRAARRERMPGTGREEPPVRRGVPEWQRWMSTQPVPEEARATLEEASASLDGPAPPAPLRLLARWPAAAASLWSAVRPLWGSDTWHGATFRLRRIVLGGMATLPHAIELQWPALLQRGVNEERRLHLVTTLAGHDSTMPGQTLTSAFAWAAFGSPDVGTEG